MTEAPADQPYFLDPRDVARSFSAAAGSYDEAAVLQTLVRNELVARLDVVALEPRTVVDAGVGTGASLAALAGRFPGARLIGVDLAAGMLRRCGRAAPAGAQVTLLRADCHRLPLASGSADLIFSNLMLPWCHDPECVLRELRRVLAPGGLLTLSTFGPDTLIELRRAWAAVDDATHVNYFYDMHDIGDALAKAGFAQPVMDVDRYTLTYADVRALMNDLKAIGARNVTAGRPRGLTGRKRLARLEAAYARSRDADGRLPASYEVVYAHAWAPQRPAQTRLEDGSVAVALGDLGRVPR